MKIIWGYNFPKAERDDNKMIGIKKIQYSMLTHTRLGEKLPHKFYEQFILYNPENAKQTGIIQAWGPVSFDETGFSECKANGVFFHLGDASELTKVFFTKIKEKQRGGYAGNIENNGLTNKYYESHSFNFQTVLKRAINYRHKSTNLNDFLYQESTSTKIIVPAFSKELMEMEAFGSW